MIRSTSSRAWPRGPEGAPARWPARWNHFERKGVKAQKLGAPDRDAFAKELQDVMRAVLQLAIYYDLRPELAASVDRSYRDIVSESWVMPLPEEREGGGG